jgi:hypothetical protein
MKVPPHDTQLLGAYVLGALDSDEQRRTEVHLAECSACQADLAELEAVRDMLDDLPPEALLHGQPDAGLVLQRTLRQVRAETTAHDRYRRTLLVAAATLVLAGAIGGGVAIGRSTGPASNTVVAPPITPTASAPAPAPGTRVATTRDQRTGGRLTASLIPADGWVRVNASISGIPAGQNCRLVVVGRDGTEQVAFGWVVSKVGEQDGTNLDGAAEEEEEEEEDREAGAATSATATSPR